MAQNNLSVSIVVSFLKHYGVRHLVLSPGTRNIPFVTTVENDPFFKCYSVVDERNAAFFALGLSQETGEAVGLACTSGTAVSNYLSGMTEAYWSRTPIIAITCDRSPYVTGQLETQKIDQIAALSSVVRTSCALPVLKDMDDVWYFERILNEAFISMYKGGGGPVHVNLPLVGDTNAMWDEKSRAMVENEIKYIDYIAPSDAEAWTRKKKELEGVTKILVVMGQFFSCDERLDEIVARFCETYNCPLLADNLSNHRNVRFVHAEAVMKGLNSGMFEEVLPDIVITFGMNFQERIKDLFKAYRGKVKHWSVDPDGEVRDCFKSQAAVFHCDPTVFFERMVGEGEVGKKSDGAYLGKWQRLAASAVLGEMPYGNFMAIREFCRAIPRKALLHVSILNATRLVQFFDLPRGVRVFGNVSTFGIDGCLPTFMGQAAVTDWPAFLVIGDVSFFYAMNAISIKHRKPNVHILLINNGGAAEFHIPPTSNSVPTIDRHIGVAHNRKAQAWAESQGYEYLAAHDKEELLKAMPLFVREGNERPILFEVFTDMKKDGEFCLETYRKLEHCVKESL